LGSPISFVANLGEGVKDFFYEPVKGITVSPEEFVKGVGKGSLSLLKNSILGVFGSASKITGSLGSGFAMLSMDEEYQEKRLQKTHKQASNSVTVVGTGLLELGSGIFDGITGIVTEPSKGALEEGGSGFVKGIGIGLFGVVIKPAVGIFDLASRTTEGIHNTPDALFVDKVEPKRFPRHFPPDNKLLPFNPRKAHGQHILMFLENGLYDKERYIAHVSILTKNGHFFVTNERVIILDSSLAIVYDVPLQALPELPKIIESSTDTGANKTLPKKRLVHAKSKLRNSLSPKARAQTAAFKNSRDGTPPEPSGPVFVEIKEMHDSSSKGVSIIQIQVKDIKTAQKLVKHTKVALNLCE